MQLIDILKYDECETNNLTTLVIGASGATGTGISESIDSYRGRMLK